MTIDTDKLIENALRDGLRDAIKESMSRTYKNPFTELIEKAILQHADSLRGMVGDAVASCLGDQKFREDIAQQTRAVLAKQLVAKFGGEMEKQVNALKSDPATRARITVAIDDIVKTSKV